MHIFVNKKDVSDKTILRYSNGLETVDKNSPSV